MTEAPVSAALARAARAAAAATKLPRGGAAPAWDTLAACPDWVLDLPGSRATLRRLGALWHAGALQRCIDGRQLQAAQDCLGAALLQALLDAELPGPGAATLPAGEALDEAFTECGRALARAALPDAALRAALAPAEVGALERLPQQAAAAWAEAAERLPAALELPR
ncbi:MULTISPECIES: hypothetical protein [Rubrivivax]|uniref:Uncharacterized protein n=2 Tax=Rubrivivax benzoatilyticus TaxID=316997 RepID=A0ABX0HP07_9BURK|nr:MULTISPECIES: hypothetical protein [Rubrivivax]NHK96809.1 hypothetical protein [Rubrivivax benzoatilyticus]NHL24524.1 hypothetical protein [Rubrivivax benzoatilyticus]